jgi:hypothetical protein
MKEPRQPRAKQPELLATLFAVAVFSGCRSEEPQSAGIQSAPLAVAQSTAAQLVTGGAAAAHADEAHDDHPKGMPPTAPATVRLRADAIEQVTTIRVMAHVGSVIIRKQGADWVTGGAKGCIVPPARIARALTDLTTLEATSVTDSPTKGNAIGMQIAVTTGRKLVLNLDVLEHGAEGDLVRLGDDSMHRVRGLDRGLWVPDAGAWCAGP